MLMLLMHQIGNEVREISFFSSRRPEYILASVAFSIFITCSDRCGGYLRAYRVMALHGKIESTTALSVSSGQNESFLY